MRLACIADDFTGATDLAGELVEAGLRVVQCFGPPDRSTAPPADADAVVVALKIRNLPAARAVEEARAALSWLTLRPAERVMFKYCSTFDSRLAGNIGPIHDALLDELDESQSISTPASPRHGRTVYLGHLFVDGMLLSDSGMRRHPLNPMTDSCLRRLLSAQSRSEVELLPITVVHLGPAAIRGHLRSLRDRARGRQIVLCDALVDDDLDAIASATNAMRLIAGGAGLGRAVARPLMPRLAPAPLPHSVEEASAGPAAVLAGSCSAATLAQVEAMAAEYPTARLSAERLADSPDLVADTVRLARKRLRATPALVAASQPREQVEKAQRRLGAEQAAQLVEAALAEIAAELCRHGVRKLIVAGGETAGAVVERLGIRQVRIGPLLSTGVPWIYAIDRAPLLLALKSGNSGEETMFIDAVKERIDSGSGRSAVGV